MNLRSMHQALLAAALAAGFALLPGAPLRADDAAQAADPDVPNAATVLAVDGAVQVDENGQWRAVEEGEPLQAGDRVRTTDNASLHLLLADGSSLVLGPNSEATLQSLGNGGEGSQTFIALASGLLNAMVEHLRPGSSFEIQTPSAVAAVKGTDFEVASGDEAHGDGVTVNQGVVQFGAALGGVSAPVHPGERRLFIHGGLGEARPLGAEEAAAFRQRWARAHERHLQRFDMIRQVRERHRADRQRFLRRLRDRGTWRRQHRGRLAGRRLRHRAPQRREHARQDRQEHRPDER